MKSKPHVGVDAGGRHPGGSSPAATGSQAGPAAQVPQPAGAAARPHDRHTPWHRLSWQTQTIGVAAFLVTTGAVHKASVAFGASQGGQIGIGLAVLGLTVALGVWRGKAIYLYFGTVQASVVLLSLVLLGTMAGTLVLQGTTPEVFGQRYGAAAPILRLLQLDDIFKSTPFRALMGLCGVASLATVIRRRHTLLRWRNWGLLATHVAVLVILVGGLIGALRGHKGMVHLQVGDTKAEFEQDGRRGMPGETLPLGFGLRLDKFELDHYQPEYNAYTYGKDTQGEYRMLASDKPKVGGRVGLSPQGGPTVVVKQVLQNAVRRNLDARHVLLFEGSAEQVVQVGQTVQLADGTVALIEDYLPDFTYDTSGHKAISRSTEPNNPVLAVRIARTQQELAAATPRYLFGRADMREMMGQGGHGKAGPVGYRHERTGVQGEGADWIEGSAGASNPALVVEIARPGSAAETAVLLAGGREPIELGAGRVLVFEEKPNSIKNYRSTLSVIRDGRVVQTQVIRVNQQLTIGTTDLYQANYDPENPNYSGIQVVQDPGLAIVVAGLWILLLGTLHAVALRNWTPRIRRGQAPTIVADDHVGAAA